MNNLIFNSLTRLLKGCSQKNLDDNNEDIVPLFETLISHAHHYQILVMKN